MNLKYGRKAVKSNTDIEIGIIRYLLGKAAVTSKERNGVAAPTHRIRQTRKASNTVFLCRGNVATKYTIAHKAQTPMTIETENTGIIAPRNEKKNITMLEKQVGVFAAAPPTPHK